MKYRRDSPIRHAAVLVPGSKRIDVNGAFKAALQAQRISFANREFVLSSTDVAYGGITVFGLPADWSIVLDVLLIDREVVVMGAGVRAAKLVLDSKLLSRLPDVLVARISS